VVVVTAAAVVGDVDGELDGGGGGGAVTVGAAVVGVVPLDVSSLPDPFELQLRRLDPLPEDEPLPEPELLPEPEYWLPSP
jgi:hypothetical protein